MEPYRTNAVKCAMTSEQRRAKREERLSMVASWSVLFSGNQAKRAARSGPQGNWRELQSGLDFESPSFQQRLRNVFGVLVLPRPFAQTDGTNVLVGLEFELLHHLLELSDRGHNRSDRFRFAPVRIAASFCHSSVCPAFRMYFLDAVFGPSAFLFRSIYLDSLIFHNDSGRAVRYFSRGPNTRSRFRSIHGTAYNIPRFSIQHKQNSAACPMTYTKQNARREFRCIPTRIRRIARKKVTSVWVNNS